MACKWPESDVTYKKPSRNMGAVRTFPSTLACHRAPTGFLNVCEFCPPVRELSRSNAGQSFSDSVEPPLEESISIFIREYGGCDGQFASSRKYPIPVFLPRQCGEAADKTSSSLHPGKTPSHLASGYSDRATRRRALLPRFSWLQSSPARWYPSRPDRSPRARRLPDG